MDLVHTSLLSHGMPVHAMVLEGGGEVPVPQKMGGPMTVCNRWADGSG